MARHESNPEEPDRCRATDLLITDCSGCRGSDESFVNALLRGEPEQVLRDSEPDYEGPDLDGREPTDRPPVPYGRPVAAKWWLDTGAHRDLGPSSHPFEASYGGSPCQQCHQRIKIGQRIVHTNRGGYAHAACLEAR